MSQFNYECPDCNQSGEPKAKDCCDTCINVFFTGVEPESQSQVEVTFDKENFESCIDDYEGNWYSLTNQQWEVIREYLQSRLEAYNEELVTDVVRDVLQGEYDVCVACNNIKFECSALGECGESK